MSLVYWSALNGNTRNFGFTNVTMNKIGSSSVLTGNGKVTSNCFRNTSRSDGGYVSSEMLDLGQNQSMFCWVYLDSFYSSANLTGILGCHRYPSNTGMGITMRYVSDSTGYLSVNTGNGTARTYNTYCGSTLLQAGTWYHVGYTYDGSTIRLYVNGNLDGEHSFTGMSLPADYFQFGAWSFGNATGNSLYAGYKLIGDINDVRVYDHTLSLKEIKEISKGLILHYDFEDEFMTDTCFDCSGYGNNGIVNGSVKIVEDSACGKHSAVFDGDTCAIQTPSLATLIQDNVYSINFWFKVHNFGSKNWGTFYGGPSGFEMSSKRAATNSPIIVAYSWGQNAEGGQVYDLDTWYMLTCTRNTSGSKWYLNGQLYYEGTAGSIPSGDYFIGAWKTATQQNFKGKIGDFKIYGRELTTDEILADYNIMTSIDKDGNIFTKEYIEEPVNAVIADRKGLVRSLNFKEGYNNVKVYGGYSKLYCLTSIDGHQYLDTGYIPSYTTGFRIELEFSISTQGKRYLLLSTYNKGNALSLEITAANYLRLYMNNGNLDTTLAITISANIKHKAVFEFNPSTKVYTIQLDNSSRSASYTTATTEPTYSMYMFVDRALRYTTFPSPMSMYSCKIYAGKNLVKDFVASRRNKDNIVGLYDFVEHKFYTNLGTGSFTSILPNGYQQVDYVQFNGTSSTGQCIRTGVNQLVHPYYVKTVYNKTNTEVRDQCLVGQRQIGKYSNLFNTYYESVYGNTASSSLLENQKATLLMKSGEGVIVNGTNILATASTSTMSTEYELLIGCFSEDSYTNAKWFFSGYIYEVEIMSNNEIIRHYIPCYRISDGVIGLYDIINNTFNTNTGAGTFGKGADNGFLSAIGAKEIKEI